MGVVAPRLRAISPTTNGASASSVTQGRARSPAATSSACGRYTNDGSSDNSSTVPGADSCGTFSTPWLDFSPSLSTRFTYDRALWVVPRSMPMA